VDNGACALRGREEELALVRATLQRVAGGSAGAVLITGTAGIGKSAVWERACDEARHAGFQVLTVRPTQAEERLSLAALDDLLAEQGPDLLLALPRPQRKVLSAALLLEESDAAPSPRALAVAFLSALRHIVASGPTVVAVDDIQWLDATSRDLLAYAIRRMTRLPVVLLLARRHDDAMPPSFGTLEASLPADRTQIPLAPLSFGAIANVVFDHVGVRLTHPMLRRVQDISGGNPLFAIELARSVIERRSRDGDDHTSGIDIDLPTTLREVVSERLKALPDRTRSALLVAAVAPDPTLGVIALTGFSATDLRPALVGGVADVSAAGRVSFTHPLLAAGVVDAAPRDVVRNVHRLLADHAFSAEARALHLACATPGPDAEVAEALDVAAVAARQRGATVAAAVLAERALRLTPDLDSSACARRASQAGWFHAESGNGARGSYLLHRGIALQPPGPRRAEAILRLLESPLFIEDPVSLGEEALAQGDEPEIVARLLSALSEIELVRGELESAHRHAERGEAVARALGDPRLWVAASVRLANLRALFGRDDEGALAAAMDVESRHGTVTNPTVRPTGIIGRRLLWHDDLEAARPLLEPLRAEALESDADAWSAGVGLYLTRLEVRAGNLALARSYADEAYDLAEAAGFTQILGASLAMQAWVAAHTGDLDAARALLARSADVTASVHDRWHGWYNSVTECLVEVSAGRWQAALDAIVNLGDELDASGLVEPGVFVFEGDALEAAATVHRSDIADQLLQRLERHPDRPRCAALASRGRAILAMQDGNLDRAMNLVETALAHHQNFTDPFERARTQVVEGSIHRRGRRVREARVAFARAAETFDQIGARAFARKATDSASRLGGRVASGGLTATEGAVADLVVLGWTNRQVAEQLVVTVKAVEGHLTHIYAKYGVHSRAELVRVHVPARATGEGSPSVPPIDSDSSAK